MLRVGGMNTEEQFWECVDKAAGPNGCWPWKGYVDNAGLGRVLWRGTQCIAHRVAHDLMCNEGRSSKVRFELCEKMRHCCNPAHLRRTDDFWANVDKNGPAVRPELGPCWVWTRSTHDFGYGRTRDKEGNTRFAHRKAWRLTYGEIPEGLDVLHRCDNPPCVRPTHLFLGTDADNVADKMAKGRESHVGCPGGDEHWSHRDPESVPRGSERGHAKLTEADVLDIRKRHAKGEAQSALADEFGIDKATLHAIVHGTKWTHVGGPIAPSTGRSRGSAHGNAKLTEEIVREIRTAAGSQSAIAAQFGISQTLVSQIRLRKIWGHVD
jgi:HNH endonuclease